MSVERSWPSIAVLFLLFGVFASLCVGAIVGGLLAIDAEDRFSQFVISSLALHGAVLFWIHLFLYGQRVTWTDAFGFRSEGALPGLALAFGVTVLVLPCTWSLGLLSAQVLELVRIEPVQQPAVTTIRSTVEIWPQVYMASAAVVLIPVAEELLFRGVLYPALRRSFGPRWGLWGSAVLFGAAHFNLMAFVPLTVLGLVLAWLYDRTRNLLVPIVAHSLFNLANLFLMTFLFEWSPTSCLTWPANS